LSFADHAHWRGLRRAQCLVWLASCALLPAAWTAAAPAEPAPLSDVIVQAVEVRENKTIDAASLLYYVSTKPGHRYDEARLRGDFRRLWATGFLDDLRLDVRDGERGKVVVFTVHERLRLSAVEYRGSKVLTLTAIESRLRDRRAELRLDTFYDAARALKVESILRDMLAEAGRPSASVRRDEKPMGPAGLRLVFVIDDGPETRVGRIAFRGNEAFSAAQLKRRMKALREGGSSFLVWSRGGSVYSEEKWLEDQQRLEDFYRTRGYATATVGAPVVSQVEGRCGTSRKRPCRQVRLEIPVTEGERYRVASIRIQGLTVFPEESVRPLIRLKPGDPYDWSRIQKAYATLRDWYGAKGHFNWTPLTRTDPHPEDRTVDVTITMQEDRQYYVGRISFVGNVTTRDKVVRRELSLAEGAVFDTEALQLSLRRLNQLGYFKPLATAPELSPSPLGEEKIDVTVRLEEQNPAQFNAGGGVSGYEGAFLHSSFSTPNLAGTGNTLRLTALGGKRVRDFDLALTNPYFLDRPVTAGVDLYHRRVIPALGSTTTAGYADQRTGIGLTAGRALGRFTRLYGNYTYEAAKVENVDANGDPLSAPVSAGSVEQALRDLYGDPGQWHDSRLTATLVHDTVDDRFTPRSGWRLSTSLQLSGGPLGGTLDAFRPNGELTFFVPATRKTAFGLHLEGGWVVPFGDTARLKPPGPGETVSRDGLPFVARFAVGGENQVRGYPFFSIFPATDADGRVVRGDGYAVLNVEHYWDVLRPTRIVAFFDAGSAFRKGDAIHFRQFRISTGLELRVTVPVLNLPFRFFYSVNPNRGPLQMASPWNVKARTFGFAIGTAF
jgi:outer membrane protein insertion porin family